jgi:signal transduction histidine kinase
MTLQLEALQLLLVEDNPGDARLLREVLFESTLEFQVTAVASLGEAHRRLETGAFDVVLLDLSLPDSSGIDTVARTIALAPETPIIVLTGLDDERLALRAVMIGAQDYLVKGDIDGRVLGRAVRYARERKRMEIERVRALEREQDARAAAEAAVRARDEVMGIVSHDLGNSLSAIGLQCRILERAGTTDVEQVARHTATIRQLVDQMHRLRQDLIDVVSIEAGRLAIELEDQPVEPILHEAFDTIGTLAQGKDLEVRREVEADLPRVRADRQRLLQVLSNLLGNAVKFTPSGGQITVQARRVGGMVELGVLDSGPGVSPEDVGRVFDAFWRKQRGERGGAGLGLAIAKGIVERHGGTIWVESEPGSGSAFRFTLPPADGGDVAGRSEPEVEEGAVPAESGRDPAKPSGGE